MANLLKVAVPCIALGCGALFAQEEPAILSADEWYKSEYAPLYSDKPWEQATRLAQHFTETVQVHNEDMETVDTRTWLADALEEWKIDGWVRSEIAELETDLLNPTTASFKTRWRDYYSGGNVGYECTWYLASIVDGTWKITDVAGINCTDHGL